MPQSSFIDTAGTTTKDLRFEPGTTVTFSIVNDGATNILLTFKEGTTTGAAFVKPSETYTLDRAFDVQRIAWTATVTTACRIIVAWWK